MGIVHKHQKRVIIQISLTIIPVLFTVMTESTSAREARESSGTPEKHGPDRQYRGQTVWNLPSIPEEEIDIGLWALIIARECDSTVDVSHYLTRLDSMTAAILYMIGPRESDMVKFAMTRMYLHDTGAWNSGQTFAYDLDDPMGAQPGAQMLTSYLDTQLGNCVSMPTLFLALMERVDSDVPFSGALAPEHMFCRLHDRQDGAIWNVEPTNGGHFMREAWVVEQFDVPKLAIDSGVYMRELSKKEYIAELLSAPISALRSAGQYEKALRYANLQLELSPRSVNGMINKASLLAWLGYSLEQETVSTGRLPSLKERSAMESYDAESRAWVRRAQSMGWKEETPESRERYLRVVAAAKQDR